MTTFTGETTVAPKGMRCTDILEDTLRGYAGIEAVDYDLENGRLQATFDPRLLSPEQALQVVQKASLEAGIRVAHCQARAARGEEACQICTQGLGDSLQEHYAAAAALPSANLNGNVIEVSLNQPQIMAAERETIQIAPQIAPQSAPAAPQAATSSRLSGEQVEILFTVLTVVFGFAGYLVGKTEAPPLVSALLYAAAYAFGGYFGLLESLAALKERSLNVDLLMILAALGAAAIGQPAEGAVLLFLFSLSNTLQSYAMDRSRRAIESLLDLRPAVAMRKEGEQFVATPIEALRLGDIVLVRPGERFPIDGQVLAGQSEVDQSPITGESTPVAKAPGDDVFAGTVNGHAALEVRVTRLAEDTTLARIVKMVEEAQATKANTQQALDAFEERYAIFVLGAAVLLIAIPTIFLGEAFQPAFYRAMTWLVVASPCALVISTPASFLSAIANAARHGVLFKGGSHLETAARIKVVAFDKTGTLTKGTPALTYLRAEDGLDEAELLRLAASVEARSEHPLAQAIVRAAEERGLAISQAESFRALVGQGVEGRIEGQKIWIGNERLFAERGLTIPARLLQELQRVEEAGQTAMLAYDASNGRWLGVLGMADTLRQDALQMIQELKAIGIERVVMLTGDNARVAAQIARRAGVDEFHAGLLPQDKVTVLEQLRKRYGPVAMVGDGINDAPSLATADLGIAMGAAGTDVAIETADVVLMSDDLIKIPYALGLARRARTVVWQNLTFALAVIVLLVAGAFGANLPLTLGVFGHEGSTVLVVLNGLRLLTYKGQTEVAKI